MTDDEKNIMTLVESARKAKSIVHELVELKEYDPDDEPGPCDVKVILKYWIPNEMTRVENGDFNEYFELTIVHTKQEGNPVDAMAELSGIRIWKFGKHFTPETNSNPVLKYGQRKSREFVEWLEGLFDEYYAKWQNTRLKEYREEHKREMEERLNWKPYEGDSESLARLAGFCAGAAEAASGENKMLND